MKTVLIIITALLLSVLAGCNGAAGEKEPAIGEKEPAIREKEPVVEEKKLLTVDFQKDRTLRYRFVSSRDIEIDWGQTKSVSERGKDRVDKSSETMEMLVAYTPLKVDPCGLTTIEATCKSVKIKRSKRPGGQAARKDAVKSLAGKSFTLTVTPTGKIEDYSQLYELMKEIGKKAFRPDLKRGRIKEPDMIGDFFATQWFLWDSISSIENPAEGVSIGQSWKSKLSVPTPMVMKEARDVTYTLDEIRQSEKGQLAVIRSSYSLAESAPRSWPMPYSGRFRMSGMFGFLRGYKVLRLEGQGEELFNIDAGRTEQYNQQYQMQLKASFPFALGANPLITIKQKLTMRLLE